MRISDWSSDVCSSDLGRQRVEQPGAQLSAIDPGPVRQLEFLALSPSEHQTEFGPDLILKTHQVARAIIALLVKSIRCPIGVDEIAAHDVRSAQEPGKDWKGVVWGKSVSVRVDLGGRRITNTNEE